MESGEWKAQSDFPLSTFSFPLISESYCFYQRHICVFVAPQALGARVGHLRVDLEGHRVHQPVLDLDRRILPGNIRANDLFRLPQHPNRVDHLIEPEVAVAPVGDRVLGREAVFIDREVNVRGRQAVDDAADEWTPVVAGDGARVEISSEEPACQRRAGGFAPASSKTPGRLAV